MALFLSILICVLFLPQSSHAQGATDFGVAQVEQGIELGGFDFPLVITKIIRAVLGFLALIMVIMTLYAGYLIMVSGGNEEKVLHGKNTLKNAIIGLAIIFFALIIVQFVINLLKAATGYEPKQPGTPVINTFDGAGSLVKLVKDHYPASNQQDIYRNTKIAITFNIEIDPSSVIENTNNTCWQLDEVDAVVIDGTKGNADYGANCKKNETTGGILEYYGDCTKEGVCDTMKPEVINIYRFKTIVDENNQETEVQIDANGEDTNQLIEADGMVAYDNSQAYTFVFKPKELLGSDKEDMWHKVVVTSGVTKMQKNKDGESVSIFNGYPNNNYPWNFETNTDIDLSPPYVVDVSPNSSEVISKNKVLKITFNEAVDPMVVQGVVSPSSSFDNILVDILYNDGNSLVQDTNTETQITIETVVGESFEYKGQIPASPKKVKKMISVGDRIYVVDSDKIIKTINVSDPSKPVNEGVWFTAPKGINAIHHDDQYIYVTYGYADRSALDILDLSNGNSVGKLAGFAFPFDVFVQGNYAYVADGIAGLKIVDISNPASLTSASVVGTLDFGGFNNAITSVYVNGQDAYVVKGGGTKDFFLVDVSNPLSPKKVKKIDDTIFGTIDILVNGNDLYTAHKADGVFISDKDTLELYSVIPNKFSGESLDGVSAISIELFDKYLLIGYQKAFKIYDITDKYNPVLKLSYPSSLEDDAPWSLSDNFRALAVHGGYAYVSDMDNGIKYFEILGEKQVEVVKDVEVQDLNSKGVKGQWKVTNGYKTVEFIPQEKCGINSCGDDIYCLYVPCADYDKECTAHYGVLVRTAQLADETNPSFVAKPFSGVLDMADNALDYHNTEVTPDYDSLGDVLKTNSSIPGKFDFTIYDKYYNYETNTGWRHKPLIFGIAKDIANTEKLPDNFWWHFTVQNKIDMTAPHIQTVNPGTDMEDVGDYYPVDILFSKEMNLDSLYNVQLREHPGDALAPDDYSFSFFDSEMVIGEDEDASTTTLSTATTLTIKHPVRPFGPNDKDFYYFGIVPGRETVADNQNCMYPGRGPYNGTIKSVVVSEKCVVKYGDDGEIQEGGIGSLCVPVDKVAETDTGCVTTVVDGTTLIYGTGFYVTQPDKDTCYAKLQDKKVSPTEF